MKQILFGITILLIPLISAFAQDAHFTQYYSNPVHLNPSFAGDAEFARLNAAYRQQWPKFIGNGFKTFHLSYDQYFRKIGGAVSGVYLYDNAAGQLINHSSKLGYAYHLQIKDQIVIKPSVQFGWHHAKQKKPTFSNMFNSGSFDPNRPKAKEIKEQINFFDLNFGMLTYYKGLSAGASFAHVNRPNISFIQDQEIRLPVRYSAHAGYHMEIIQDFSMGVSFLYMKQESADMKIPSIGAKYKWAKLDIGYRIDDAVLFVVGYEGEKLQIGYSFDLTISDLTLEHSGGAHEATMIYIIRPKNKTKSILTTGNFMM